MALIYLLHYSKESLALGLTKTALIADSSKSGFIFRIEVS